MQHAAPVSRYPLLPLLAALVLGLMLVACGESPPAVEEITPVAGEEPVHSNEATSIDELVAALEPIDNER